ncbi:MAG: sporulation peptidase YabG [Bacillota bacterium]|nr:sporulation peptidase YabG [Bacillota bacterium]
MKEVRIGDVVTRKSYGGDVFFRVEAFFQVDAKTCALLRGLYVRLCADAPVDDLEKKNITEVTLCRREFLKKQGDFIRKARTRQSHLRQATIARNGKKEASLNFFELPGRVLHLDGDREYRELCLHTYLQLDVPCRVLHVPEREQPALVYRYLREERPDILVLTGHDGFLKGKRDYRSMESYRHSQYFCEAVRRAREYEPGRDDLVIIAGGCQSYYEALIEAGANFASAPERVMIHVLDPVFIAEKIAFTSIYEKIFLPEILDHAVTGQKGIGGVQTRGKFRLGLPRSPY